MDWDSGFSLNSPEFLLLGEAEIEEFRSEKTVTGTKSLEEIEKLMVDESLSPLNRASLLLNTGQEVQKVYSIEQLPSLLHQQQEQTLSKILPKLCDILSSSSSDIQIAAGKSFVTIATEQMVPKHIFTSSFLPTILRQVDCRDTTISSVWLEALLAAIPLLNKDLIRRDILSLAVSRAQLSQSVSSRKSSCLIIGKMAERFEPFWLKKELLPLASSLCQDVDYEVRATMCSQLTILAHQMGPDLAQSCILPELTELTSDEEASVRSIALETITDTISVLTHEVVTSSVVPLVKAFCERSLASGCECLANVARLLGRLSFELKDVMSGELRDWFIRFYRQLSEFDGVASDTASTSSVALFSSSGLAVECRHYCAFNLPALTLLAGRTSFKSCLCQTFQQLASHESPRVRTTVARGYHEVVRLLGDKCLILASTYQALLKDKCTEVLQGLATHLPQTLKLFAEASNFAPYTMQPGLLDFISPLLSAETTACSGLQWRLHEQLIGGFSSLVNCLTSEQIYARFVPLLFKHITGPYVRPVRMASCRTLACFIKNSRKQALRVAMCDRIVEECAKSSSCRDRLLFLDICKIIMATFSRSFFKEHFFKAALDLGNDPVINIRIRLSSLLPALKTVLKFPSDRALLQALEQMVRQMLSQAHDSDSAQAVQQAILEMDRIQVAMDSLTRKTFFEADHIDQQREEEERKRIEMEERENEREREKEGGNGVKKVVSGGAKNSPASHRRQTGKKAAGRTSSYSGHGSTSSLPHYTLPAGPSPSTQRKGLTVNKRGSCTPSSSRVSSPLSRSDSSPLEHIKGGGGGGGGGRGGGGGGGGGRGEEIDEKRKLLPNKSNPSSPHLGRLSKASNSPTRSASNSPNTTSKLSVSKHKEISCPKSGSSTKRKANLSSNSKSLYRK